MSAALDAMQEQRELLALLLVWEIGKPWRLAQTHVDRGIDGVRWYVAEIERQLAGRRLLSGPVSNIASWNYPVSVKVHAELVQVLAGNGVVAKTPSQGGFHCLTLAHALMRRGYRSPCSPASDPSSGTCSSAARASARSPSSAAGPTGVRLPPALPTRVVATEQEGLNAWGVWDFSQWDQLAGQLKKGFEYAKQRCTAYPRYVVQRRLFPEFLQMHLGVFDGLRWAIHRRSRPTTIPCPSSTSAR